MSQAYGAENRARCDTILSSALVVTIPVMLVIGSSWLTMGWLLEAIQLQASVARLAGSFLLIRFLGLPFVAFREIASSFLYGLRETKLPMYVSVASNLFVLMPLLVLLPPRIGGIFGVAIALTLVEAAQALALGVIMYCVVPMGTAGSVVWDGGIVKEVILIGVPSTLMSLSEWVGLEVVCMMPGWVCSDICTDLSVNAIATMILQLGWTLTRGFYSSGSVLVGAAIGEGDVPKARVAFNASVLLTVGMQSVLAAVLLLGRDLCASFFTDDADVRETLRYVLLFVAAYLFIASQATGMFMSTFECLNLVIWPAVLSSAIFIPGNILFAYVLAFKEGLGIYGLWASLDVSILLLCGSYCAYLFCVADWALASKLAQARSAA